jgi:hypothetical protein
VLVYMGVFQGKFGCVVRVCEGRIGLECNRLLARIYERESMLKIDRLDCCLR